MVVAVSDLVISAALELLGSGSTWLDALDALKVAGLRPCLDSTVSKWEGDPAVEAYGGYCRQLGIV